MWFPFNFHDAIVLLTQFELPIPIGNHKGGISVGKAIASGCQAADLVISYLNSSSGDNECID